MCRRSDVRTFVEDPVQRFVQQLTCGETEEVVEQIRRLEDETEKVLACEDIVVELINRKEDALARTFINALPHPVMRAASYVKLALFQQVFSSDDLYVVCANLRRIEDDADRTELCEILGSVVKQFAPGLALDAVQQLPDSRCKRAFTTETAHL